VLLSKDRRNEIFNALVSAGFDPRDFEISGEIITHRPTGSTLSVGRAGHEHFITVSRVGDRDSAQKVGVLWPTVIETLWQWANAVEQDAAEPDLWAELVSETAVVGLVSGPGVENAPFTHAERSEVLSQLREIREYAARSLDLTESQTRELNGRLGYLEEASERLGRKDWANIALGTVISMVTAAIIPASDVRNVLTPLPYLPPPQ
jgi:hypothetical protein